MHDLRKYPRVVIKVLVDYEESKLLRLLVDYSDSEAYLYDYSTNLSEGGIFIKTQRFVEKGTTLQIKFSFPDSAKLFDVECKVVWINTANGPIKELGPGMGIEFINLNDSMKDEITNFIKKACRQY
ncbi:MAG TPA: TIGR02266 family protein [bacterium]